VKIRNEKLVDSSGIFVASKALKGWFIGNKKSYYLTSISLKPALSLTVTGWPVWQYKISNRAIKRLLLALAHNLEGFNL